MRGPLRHPPFVDPSLDRWEFMRWGGKAQYEPMANRGFKNQRLLKSYEHRSRVASLQHSEDK